MSYSVNNNQTGGKKSSAGRKLLMLVIILLILGAAAFVGSRIIKSTPKAMRKAPDVVSPYVDFKPLEVSSEQVVISAMGTLVPSREVALKSEVSGRVISISDNFELASHVAAGENLVAIEQTDYEVAVAQAESQVAQAAYDLDIELGNQEIAVQEWELYDNKAGASQQDKDLALRKPHLVKAQAEYKSAQAQLEQAQLNLKRTAISAPFNAMVIAKEIETGSMLMAQGTVATLVATDSYWVQVSIPVDRLSWIDIPISNNTEGSLVEITAGDKVKLGRIYKLLPDIEESGRMARVLVEISDPLDLKKPADQRQPLLLGEFARVEIEGKTLQDIVSIPSSSLHNGNQLWLLDAEDKLDIVTAEILWRGSDSILLKNTFTAGTKLVTSNLATPVAGMQLRTESSVVKTQDMSSGMSKEGAEAQGDRQEAPQEGTHE